MSNRRERRDMGRRNEPSRTPKRMGLIALVVVAALMVVGYLGTVAFEVSTALPVPDFCPPDEPDCYVPETKDVMPDIPLMPWAYPDP